ncbi:MAG TPA: DUF2867 domain-containing protein [Acidimicrobiales bacterium]|nr:DUF2867 domain-containing protein [Acidimicrobiales bacterium]
MVRIAVVGATGFVGRALSAALVDEGHEVVALSRRPSDVGGAMSVAVDVADEPALQGHLTGCEVAFYLVHSLSTEDFRTRDRGLAEGFGRAAAAAGVQRIVYLGGLGHDPESEHLASRQEVGVALAAARVPVVELRAAVVLGAGSISFEMLRYLTERLPFMVCPRWVHTAIQPIAVADVIRYLLGAIDVAPGTYEIGGADVTSYREMIAAYAEARGLRSRRIVDVPFLTPRLSSYWLDLVTPVDRRVSHALVESLVTEVVVRDRKRTDAAFGIRPVGLGESLSAALDEQARALDRDVLNRLSGLEDGVYTVRVALPIPQDALPSLDADLDQIGGSFSWYGVAAAWRIRALLGRLAGEYWELRRPPAVVEGQEVDWWRVTRREAGALILRSIRWVPGDAWLGYQYGGSELIQVGSLRPKGIPGFLYWILLKPVHLRVFKALARRRVSRGTSARRIVSDRVRPLLP